MISGLFRAHGTDPVSQVDSKSSGPVRVASLRKTRCRQQFTCGSRVIGKQMANTALQ